MALIVCFCSYFIVLVICFLIYPLVDQENPVLNAVILDLIGTVLIFLVSWLFNNSSFYDPYWSIAPLPIIFYWVFSRGENELSFRHVVLLVLVITWGTRLTLNWVRRWNGFNDEDWRYVNFRKRFKKSYWIVSFLGIHLIPTLVVFAGCLSAYPAITHKPSSIDSFDIFAIVILLIAILTETISDEQLRKYLKTSKNQSFLSSGLWRYSRHPNYFGEVLFWTGLFLFSLGSSTFYWWTLAGPVGMILLFSFISIPMIDKRMVERKPGYAEYIKKSTGLIFWYPKGK